MSNEGGDQGGDDGPKLSANHGYVVGVNCGGTNTHYHHGLKLEYCRRGVRWPLQPASGGR